MVLKGRAQLQFLDHTKFASKEKTAVGLEFLP